VKVTVITVSDRAFKGAYTDQSGPKIVQILKENFDDIVIETFVIPDDADILYQSFVTSSDSDFIITTGGTGLSERDITPETTECFCTKEIPGISEVIRRESCKETPNAMLSRAYSGFRGKCIIVNMPGSPKAVELATKVIVPIMKHAINMFRGKEH